MGSCSSKARSIRDGSNLREEYKDETNRGVEDEHPSAATMSSEMAENTTTQGNADAANGGESSAGATSHEQHTAPKVGRQSFSWLASSPVVLNTTTKELKAKGKRPKEGSSGRETSNVLKYSNAKYLKFWQQLPTLLSSANTTRQAQGDASTSSTSSSSGYGVNKEKSNQARQPEPGNISEASSSRGGSFPVGFGAVGKQGFPRATDSARPIVHTSRHCNLSLDEEKGKGKIVLPPKKR
ncbi:hypothetical protein OS493_038686 [Desmophyllum pertusum]|uniref:Uncharacterized protein n=1 Tax=Desmophyllum pertusum TaxID=174260 RepID=A0A9W9Z6D3_9CNID|nr:hypothetical protein OS493_038686 [Desmophyllum pertusum]